MQSKSKNKNNVLFSPFRMEYLWELTTAALARTIGRPKLLITNPIVTNIDSSKHGVEPDNELTIERLANNVGQMDKI